MKIRGHRIISRNAAQPLVSVVVPVFNSENFLEQCLDSISNQTLKDIEIICINDGSEDRSQEILNKYVLHDNRIKIINQENRGAGNARNVGLRIARGKYISFLDSDDFFEKDMFKKAVRKIEQDNADFVVFKCDHYLNDTGVFRDVHYSLRIDRLPTDTPFNYRQIRKNVFAAFEGWAWDKLYRREFVVQNHLSFQEQRTTNDMRFVFLALVLADRITYIDNVLAHQRRNNKASLSNTRERSWACFYFALSSLKDNLKKLGKYDELEQDFINYALHACVWNMETIGAGCFDQLKTKIREVWAYDLGIAGKERDYFYIKQEFDRFYELIDRSSKRIKVIQGMSGLTEKLCRTFSESSCTNFQLSPYVVSEKTADGLLVSVSFTCAILHVDGVYTASELCETAKENDELRKTLLLNRVLIPRDFDEQKFCEQLRNILLYEKKR